MKIQRLETFTRGNLSVVRLTTDTGDIGWGQIAPFHADISATVLHRLIAPRALGTDFEPDAFETLADEWIEANYKFPWSFVCRAAGGVDTALWDLRGRLTERSVCELLGGTPRPFPVYGSSMRRDITPADEAARLVRLRDEAGYTAFKIRLGRVNGRDVDQWPGRTEALIPAVRRALGDDVTLYADGNSGFGPARAIAVGRRLEDHGFGHFEEPCPYWELEQTAEVAAALEIPVAGGEQDCDPAQWRRMIRLRAVDIVQPDVCYCGGFSRARAIAGWAAEAGLACVPHSANRSLVTVFALHLMGALPNARPEVEFSIEPTPWTDDFLTEPLTVIDGQVMIPAGPGWGVTIQPAWLAAAERQVSEF